MSREFVISIEFYVTSHHFWYFNIVIRGKGEKSRLLLSFLFFVFSISFDEGMIG
ncbi:hypothetical protein Lalb_Chr07g0180801 [Lupinus albus]|uniref:Uncharacterized protein n=1 Tax=Lupinus albus TaxID=3870 RepID=A0A6A4Q7L5_LUPAL|nr:hypothetical protein Lalb_Chr07g0180801 [Lupinus albus]